MEQIRQISEGAYERALVQQQSPTWADVRAGEATEDDYVVSTLRRDFSGGEYDQLRQQTLQMVEDHPRLLEMKLDELERTLEEAVPVPSPSHSRSPAVVADHCRREVWSAIVSMASATIGCGSGSIVGCGLGLASWTLSYDVLVECRIEDEEREQ